MTLSGGDVHRKIIANIMKDEEGSGILESGEYGKINVKQEPSPLLMLVPYKKSPNRSARRALERELTKKERKQINKNGGVKEKQNTTHKQPS